MAVVRSFFDLEGYSVGVTVSYSWDFLICINFCETIEFFDLHCEVGLYIKCLIVLQGCGNRMPDLPDS